MNVEQVTLADIKIRPDRIRKEIVEIEELAESIKTNGLLHPLTLDRENYVVAGFRRFLAVHLLKWTTVPAVRRDDLSPFERLRIELEENTRRRQLSWQEESAAKLRLHAMMVAIEGEPRGKSRAVGWSVGDTAKLLNESVGKVSEDLRLAQYTKHAVVGARSSRVEAIRTMRRTVEIAKFSAIASLLKGVQNSGAADPGTFTRGRVWRGLCQHVLADQFADNSVDLILTDPPYGIEIEQARWARVSSIDVYKDAPQAPTQALVKLMLREAFRILKPECYIFMFCPAEFTGEWRSMMIDVGFSSMPRPLIWYKQRGSLTDFFFHFAPAYETFLCGWKGEKRRPLSTPLADVFTYPRPLDRWHKLERAPGLLDDVIKTASAENELVLDPFCGGGSTLASAVRNSRRYAGIESDEQAWARAVERMKLLETGGDDLLDPTGGADGNVAQS